MNIRNAVLAIALGVALSGAASAQVISYSPRTGDVWIDTQLGYVNDYGRMNRAYFVDDVVATFGAPRYLVNDLVTTRGWAPADVYYACALASQVHRPCGDIVNTYGKDRGQGWGVIAMRMGIKPGSAEFHALKGQVGKSGGKFKAKLSSPGNSGKAKSEGFDDDSPGNSGNKGKSDDGPGNSGKGNSGKDKGNKGKGKGGSH